MSLNDKIIKAYSKYGALSSREVTDILKEEFKVERSHRTIQRHITTLVEDGKLRPGETVGREQAYILCREKPSAISDFFLNKFWNELFMVREELHKDYGSAVLALLRLHSLVKMLPKHLKAKVEHNVEKVISRIDVEMGMIRFNEKKSLSEHEIAEFQIVTELLDKVSTLLHEELKSHLNEKEGDVS